MTLGHHRPAMLRVEVNDPGVIRLRVQEDRHRWAVVDLSETMALDVVTILTEAVKHSRALAAEMESPETDPQPESEPS